MKITRRSMLMCAAGLCASMKKDALRNPCKEYRGYAPPIAPNHDNIIKILDDRRDSNYQPGTYSDRHKVGLVIEGGGMRAPLTGGQITALQDNGLINSFDAVYCNSSGAVTASHGLAGNPQDVTLDFTVKLTTAGGFLESSRFFPYLLQRLHMTADQVTARPVMDLDFFMNLEKDPKILDVSKILQSPLTLKIMVTDLDDQKLLIVTPKTREEFFLYLRASCTIPGIAGQPVLDANGHRLADGRIASNCPVQQAIDDGCTRVVVLTSRPLGSPLFSEGIEEWGLLEAIRLVQKDWNEGSRLITFAEEQMRKNSQEVKRATHDPRFMFLGLPEDHEPIKSSETDRNILWAASVLCYDTTMKVLNRNSATRPNIIRWKGEACKFEGGV